MQKKYKTRLWIKKQAVFSRLKLFVLARVFKYLKRISRFHLLKKQEDKIRKKALKFAKKQIPLTSFRHALAGTILFFGGI